MQIIPVIDVQGGVAVRAVKGERSHYLPLKTPLAASADPVAVAEGLGTLYPFRTLYVADLDGIMGRGANVPMQSRLIEDWRGAEVWIDDGSRVPVPSSRAMRVRGSESMSRLEEMDDSAILSLDFQGDTFIGPPLLLAEAALWPRRVIVMTLARVGGSDGPDIARLETIIARSGHREIYAAGGVRDVQDLRHLKNVGAAGALVASALHSGQIKTGDLEKIAG